MSVPPIIEPHPPATDCPIWCTSVNAETFDNDGMLKFNFATEKGQAGANRLVVQLTGRDEETWWGGRRLRASLNTMINQSLVYDRDPSTRISKIFTFDTKLNTTPDKYNSGHRLNATIHLRVFAVTDALPFISNGTFTGPVTNVGGTLVYSLILPFQFCRVVSFYNMTAWDYKI